MESNPNRFVSVVYLPPQLILEKPRKKGAKKVRADCYLTLHVIACSFSISMSFLLTQMNNIYQQQKIDAEDEEDTPLLQPDPNKGPSRESWTSLLDGGHDFKTYGHTNASALLASIVGGHVTVVDELLASGANINNADALGVTPLMASIAHGEDAIVDKLVASSASVNAVDNAGNNCIKVGTSSHHSITFSINIGMN